MRRSSLILLFSIACFSAHAQDTHVFSGYKWGTPFTAMQGQFDLKPLKVQDSTARYSSNISSLGEADLDDCQFEFTSGKFSGILATTPGESDSKKLLHWLESRFGPGENREPLGWQWFKEGTHIWFDMSKSGGEGWLYWYSLEYQPLKGKP
jgi:hypothetical protein